MHDSETLYVSQLRSSDSERFLAFLNRDRNCRHSVALLNLDQCSDIVLARCHFTNA